MTISVGDRMPEAGLFEPGESGPEKLSSDALFRRPQGRARRHARRLHADLPSQPPPRLHREPRRDPRQGRRRDRRAFDQRHACAARLGGGERRQGQGPLRLRRQPDFITQTGLSFDGSGTGMGTRARRFAMIVDDGVVTMVAVEDEGRSDGGQLRRADPGEALEHSLGPSQAGAAVPVSPCQVRRHPLRGRARRRARSGHGRHGRSPSASRLGGRRPAAQAPARDRRSSPACGRRSSSRSASSRGSTW